MGPRLAMLVERVGPYHAARLRALSTLLGSGRLRVLEVAGASARYAWDAVALDGVEVTRLFPDHDYAGMSRSDLRRAVTRALHAMRPHAVAVNGWGFPEARAAIGWCRSSATPAILMSDSQERDSRRWYPLERLKRRYVRACGSAFVAGARHAAYVEKLGLPRERVVRGYDVVDNAHFARGADEARSSAPGFRAKLGLPERYWLACARFVPQKNLAALLQAFAAYRGQAGSAAWDLVLLGDGPLRGELDATARGLGMHGSVHTPGFIQYPELPAYYGLASGFVLPSLVEPWGLVANEAMAAGLPVLVSEACGCVPELVREGENGHVFDPRDTAGLADLLVRVAGSPRLAEMGRASREVVAAFTPETFAANMSRAIDIALGANGGSSRSTKNAP